MARSSFLFGRGEDGGNTGWLVRRMSSSSAVAQLEAFRVPHIVGCLLRFFTEGINRAVILQIGDKSILVWMSLDLTHLSSDHSYSIVFTLLDCSMEYLGFCSQI